LKQLAAMGYNALNPSVCRDSSKEALRHLGNAVVAAVCSRSGADAKATANFVPSGYGDYRKRNRQVRNRVRHTDRMPEAAGREGERGDRRKREGIPVGPACRSRKRASSRPSGRRAEYPRCDALFYGHFGIIQQSEEVTQ